MYHLVVPEVNAVDIQRHRGIIASPNCSTILLNVALYPLHKTNPIKRVVVSTYQSTSGMGLGRYERIDNSIAANAGRRNPQAEGFFPMK